MKKTISIGEVLLDVYTKDGISQVEVGGASFNVACSIAAIKDNQSYFMGALGSDKYTTEINKIIHKFNLEKDFIKTYSAPNTIAKVTLDAKGERNFNFLRKSDNKFKFSRINQDSLNDLNFVHFGSATAFLRGKLRTSYKKMLAYCLANEIKFSFDPNFRDKLWKTKESIKKFRKLCSPYISGCDLLKFSEEKLFLLTEIHDLDLTINHLMQINFRALICITRGSKDTLIGWNKEILNVPTISLEKVIDTTGAGDAFVAKLINEFVNKEVNSKTSKEDIFEIIKSANQFANNAVKYFGAITFLDHLSK
ncbi:fructokinase [Williamsoniiplasma somnilux]|uniref:Fructokinase n=1 Tax=Williamsoniiplasma somnilux TaxID=215578 RepID=A0A2K8NXM1_9MOLU|nr:carbohydrate kinase [Williamsoniiplasma somnilux]ATZ18585.1 fructokinase [Williamsoniiplasma somnilux]